jgi:hypothetical protein
MEVLTSKHIASIKSFFRSDQKSLLKALDQYLRSKYKTVYSTSDYIMAIGEIPIALVAHLDTVFLETPMDIYYDQQEKVLWSPDGLGADDRAGVWAIIQIIKSGFKPTIIFTTDEERGGIGATKLIKNISKDSVDLKYIIELDRHGSDDCVFYDCDVPEFEDYIESFGFITNFGSFSDISVICPNWKVAGVNLSIGYYNEHSYSEFLNIEQTLKTISRVKKMLLDAPKAQKFVYKENMQTKIYKNWYNQNYTNILLPCSKCQKLNYEYDLFPVKTENQSTIFLCCDCVAAQERLSWCQFCNEPFMIKKKDNKNRKICYDCSKGESAQ